MRLPEDDEQAASVVSRAIDLGVNYLETSEWYCESRSEIKVGIGVRGRRDQVYISSKSKVNPETTQDDTLRAFERSLKRLGVDRVDFYQVWDYKAAEFDAVTKKGGALDLLERLKSDGLIGHIGFTSHETNEELVRMIDTGRFESCTLSYHMLNRTVEPVIEFARERGLGVVCMTPLAGGLLATPSDVLRELLPGQYSSMAASALAFVLSTPGITTAPSGMTSVAEVEANVAAIKSFAPMSHEERAAAVRALEEYSVLGQRFCTGCGYCQPCPSGVRIPRLFGMRNYYQVFGLEEWARQRALKIPPDKGPWACTECGECEPKCPHGIPIVQQLKEVAALIEELRR
ncbi:MAG: aldo/keto reductase [Armatimonadetes bacterium]|nr:aldo/keto reductase [Armatimonadota bacterium]